MPRPSIPTGGAGGRGVGSRTTLLLHVLILLVVVGTPIHAIPVTYTIPHNQKECLYEQLDAGEYVTMSVFILTGAELKGKVMLQGPVARDYAGGHGSANDKASEAKRIHSDIAMYEKGHLFGREIINKYQIDIGGPSGGGPKSVEINYQDQLDFETLAEEADNRMHDDYYPQDDDMPDMYHEMVGDDDEIPPAELKRLKAKFESQREKLKAMREQRKAEKQKTMASGDIRRNGESWQKTVQVKVPGWYRACVNAAWYQITSEIEFRASSALGPPDESTGHVQTYEMRALTESQKFFVPDAAEQNDLKETQDMISKLQRLMDQIRRKQQIERHELKLHQQVNEHSHSRMVLSSLLETVLFITVTGFQVYSIRKWFDAAPMLGR